MKAQLSKTALRQKSKAKSPADKPIAAAVKHFGEYPDCALVTIPTAEAVSGRSRASIYRHFKAGELTIVKLGCSTRIRVGELRRLIGATA